MMRCFERGLKDPAALQLVFARWSESCRQCVLLLKAAIDAKLEVDSGCLF